MRLPSFRASQVQTANDSAHGGEREADLPRPPPRSLSRSPPPQAARARLSGPSKTTRKRQHPARNKAPVPECERTPLRGQRPAPTSGAGPAAPTRPRPEIPPRRRRKPRERAAAGWLPRSRVGRERPLTFVSLGDLRHFVHSNTQTELALPRTSARRRHQKQRLHSERAHPGTRAALWHAVQLPPMNLRGACWEWEGPGRAPGGFLKTRAEPSKD